MRSVGIAAIILFAITSSANAQQVQAEGTPQYDSNGYDAISGTYDKCQANPVPAELVDYCRNLIIEKASEKVRLQSAKCPIPTVDTPVPYKPIMVLSEKKFIQCWNLTGADTEASQVYYAMVRYRADAEWQQNKARCRQTPGCVLIEGRIEPE